MEILWIGPTRLKLRLTEEDRRRYGLNDGALQGEGLREKLAALFARQGEEEAFRRLGRRLYVRAFEEKDGACELFLCGVGSPRLPWTGLALGGMEPLLHLCRRLGGGETPLPESRLLYADGWYLLFWGELPLAAADFGEPLREETVAYLAEYATPVLPAGAITVLAGLA